jgi:hypothetical protein
VLRRLVLWVDGWAELDRVRREFPTVELNVAAGAVPRGPNVVHVAEWWGESSAELDARLEGPHGDGGPEGIVAVAESAGEGTHAALQILTRYQHRLGRRNAQSQTPGFDQVLRRHRCLHDLSQIFVRADFIHSVDTWQWTLRLQPNASLALQIAALFHDVERSVVEPNSRSEPVGPSYQLLKDAHARASARLAQFWLANLELDAELVRAAALLIEGHERPATCDEQAVLNSADALSFISRGTEVFPSSLLSWRLRRAVSRLSLDGLTRLSFIRCAPEVSHVLEACLSASPAEPPSRMAAM